MCALVFCFSFTISSVMGFDLQQRKRTRQKKKKKMGEKRYKHTRVIRVLLGNEGLCFPMHINAIHNKMIYALATLNLWDLRHKMCLLNGSHFKIWFFIFLSFILVKRNRNENHSQYTNITNHHQMMAFTREIEQPFHIRSNLRCIRNFQRNGQSDKFSMKKSLFFFFLSSKWGLFLFLGPRTRVKHPHIHRNLNLARKFSFSHNIIFLTVHASVCSYSLSNV